MGFGDFAMGYLIGQSFSGPNHIPDGNAPYSEWSSQAKKDWDKKCDEAYWRAWDRACKEGVIKRLRNPNDTLNLLTLNHQPIYEGISRERQAALIESGELKIVAQTQGAKPIISSMWADDSREEAQNPTYRKLKTINLKEIEQGIQRVVM